MAFINNVDELVAELRPRLSTYLEKHLGPEVGNTKNKFHCFAHEDKSPSCSYNPKSGYQTFRCWSGCGDFDIFRAASIIENLPIAGPEFITETLPALAEQMGLQVQIGATSPADREKTKLLKLANDIANILEAHTSEEAITYCNERNWSRDRLTIGSIDAGELTSRLQEQGWSQTDIISSMMIRTNTTTFIDSNMLTFVVRDYRGRPVGFISRNLGKNGPKYINSHESVIYEKKKILLGIDTALKAGAKKDGLYIVEGPGDLAALHRVGIYNVAAVCGTAFTGEHLALLKMLGIRQAYFSLDWDEAGISATERILMNEIKFAPGVSCSVLSAPETGEKDPSELICSEKTGQKYLALSKTTAFEWVLARISDKAPPDDVCTGMVPLIAAETSAIRRELLTKQLSDFTEISYQSITQDVSAIRDGKEQERRERLEGAAQRYMRAVSADPANLLSALTQHEVDIEEINKEYEKTIMGASHQTGRFDALEEIKATAITDKNLTEFQFGYYKRFGAALSGGMSATDGNLVYFGGRANAGKTAVTTSLGIDVAIHDPFAIVIMHWTDDAYSQVTPRLVTGIATIQRAYKDPKLTIGQAANPYRNITSQDVWNVYQRAAETLRTLLAEERLILIDSEDGNTLSPLEKQIKYARTKYPEKKILVIADNSHNYNDHAALDQTNRMRIISTSQKNMTIKYHCAMFATVEYRKNMPGDTSKMKLPVNDDIADARAMMYRPNIIIHVYNDLNDRGEDATIQWIDKETKTLCPRLMLVFGKNKITSFKSPENKIMMDLDPATVSLTEKDLDEARTESKISYELETEIEQTSENLYYIEAEV
jgi:DNA primase catalytic core